MFLRFCVLGSLFDIALRIKHMHNIDNSGCVIPCLILLCVFKCLCVDCAHVVLWCCAVVCVAFCGGWFLCSLFLLAENLCLFIFMDNLFVVFYGWCV